MNPPKVYEDTYPSNQKTIKMTAIVSSIFSPFLSNHAPSSRPGGILSGTFVGMLRGVHLITLSALANTLGGMVRPICLAVFKLMTNSNFVGCSTGKSAGLAPFTVLFT